MIDHAPDKDIALVKDGVVVQLACAPCEPSWFGPAPDGELIDLDPGAAVVGMLWDGTALSAPAPDLAAQKSAKLAALRAAFAERLAAGYPTAGLHVAIDDGSRANLSGMGATALGVIAGVAGVSWPANYARGWIAIEGARIELADAAAGLALATGAGGHYAALAQNGQDIADAIDAAADQAALDAIDLSAGWP